MNTFRNITHWLAYACLLALLVVSAACGGSSPYMSKSVDAEAEAPGGGAYAGDAVSEDASMVEADGERFEVAQLTRAPSGATPPAAPPAPVSATDASPPPQGQPKPPASDPSSGGDQTPKQVAGPLLIYRAEVNMAVFETRAVIDRTEKLARDMGGYLVRRSDREIIVRVPSAKFREALAQVGGYGDVLHQNVDVEDVTEKFYDLSIRLKNMKAVRDRFEQLLTKAQTVEDSLKIERELERVTTQIEVLEGKLKLYRELIAFSTITLRLEPRGTDQVAPKVNLPFEWLRKLGLPSLLSM